MASGAKLRVSFRYEGAQSIVNITPCVSITGGGNFWNLMNQQSPSRFYITLGFLEKCVWLK